MSIPMLDLTRQYAGLKSEIQVRIDRVLEAQSFILGRTVEELEEAVASDHGVAHAIGVASGTDALLLPLHALGLRPGDEVVTTPFTFFATAGTIHNAGGRPVFVDVDPETFNIDPEQVERVVTSRTRAIVPVHLFGQMAPMEPLRRIAGERGIFLLEDAAQAIGARQKTGEGWLNVGQAGDAATLSFFPSKNLGGYGDGGMILTNDADLAGRLRRLRVHGGLKMYHHEEVGLNSRLDALQASVLLAKLPYLAEWTESRRAHAAWYDEQLADLESAGVLRCPRVLPESYSVYNQYTVRATERDALKRHLEQAGIGCAVYYPLPLHLQPCFEYLGYRPGDFPIAEQASREVLSLPVYPELRAEEREQVVASIREFYAHR